MGESLQDALYLQSLDPDERIDELRHRTQPGELARALTADARRRGPTGPTDPRWFRAPATVA